MPDVYVSVSSRILPEFREFERMSTTVVNAFTGPRMGRYLDEFRRRVASLGIPAEPYTIHSNGGLMSVETARDCPVRTCVSGPAAGVVGAAAIGVLAGFPDLITFDVGGTSTDVSLIDAGLPLFTGNRLVAGYPVKTPMIDIHVIGAGGGSIAAVDSAGRAQGRTPLGRRVARSRGLRPWRDARRRSPTPISAWAGSIRTPCSAAACMSTWTPPGA